MGSSKVETLKVPFFVSWVGEEGFSNGANYWAKFCAKSSTKAAPLKDEENPLRLPTGIKKDVEKSFKIRKSGLAPQGSITTILEDRLSVSWLILVLYLLSF